MCVCRVAATNHMGIIIAIITTCLPAQHHHTTIQKKNNEEEEELQAIRFDLVCRHELAQCAVYMVESGIAVLYVLTI